MRMTSNYALRLPVSLKRPLEEVVREDGTMLNQFIVSAVGEKLAVLKTAEYFTKRAARADFSSFDCLMRRGGGEAPRPDDEIPESYRIEEAPTPAQAVVSIRSPNPRSNAGHSPLGFLPWAAAHVRSTLVATEFYAVKRKS